MIPSPEHPYDPAPHVKGPPPPDRRQAEAGKKALLARMRQGRLWPPGKAAACPVCRRKAFVGRDDLHVEVPRGGVVHVFRHLHGAACKACGATLLEPYEDISIEGELASLFVPDFEAKVTNIGSKTVGTYWPKDVQRLAGLRKGRKLRIQVLDRDTLLLRVRG